MAEQDETKKILERLLSDLYSKQAATSEKPEDSCLVAEDGQYLGRITTNDYDSNSILNTYGPYGSPYSTTSIFNGYSQYGSPYGQFSVNNPYCVTPPKLFLHGKLIGRVTKNQYVVPNIPTDGFLYTLKNDIQGLLTGRIGGNPSETKKSRGESFVEAQDGSFLGSLQSRLDQESIFNKFGPYGSNFSPKSIFNRFGPYGGEFSPQSPFNRLAQTPPRVFHRGEFVAYLTTNKFLNPRIHPDELEEWASRNVAR